MSGDGDQDWGRVLADEDRVRFYCGLNIDYTDDPHYTNGIKSCDLNAGLVDVDEFLALWDVIGQPPDEPTDAEKLDALWDHHPELH